MINVIKVTLIFILSAILAFGFWYLIGWFISGESNLFLWTWYGKVVYLIFGFTTLSSVVDGMTR